MAERVSALHCCTTYYYYPFLPFFSLDIFFSLMNPDSPHAERRHWCFMQSSSVRNGLFRTFAFFSRCSDRVPRRAALNALSLLCVIVRGVNTCACLMELAAHTVYFMYLGLKFTAFTCVLCLFSNFSIFISGKEQGMRVCRSLTSLQLKHGLTSP